MTPRFRVWNGSEMYYPPHAYLLTGDGKVVEHTDPIDTQHEVMLSTGLTDAEGTEIWEGDVIRFYMIGTQVRYKVVWCERYGQWYTETLDGAIMNPLSHILNRDEDTPTVIGNVHEHEAALD